MLEWKISKEVINYKDAIYFMNRRTEAIIVQKSSELVWFLEHTSTYTAGTGAQDKDLLKSMFPIIKTSRGGKITYHGPGQLVVYLLIDLKKRKQQDIKRYVYNLENIIINTLRELSLFSQRLDGKIGVWIPVCNTYKKIAAIGIRARKWVTLHGFALNIHTDLKHYEGIIPCGISEYGVTSLNELGITVDKETIIRIIQREISDTFFNKRA